MIIPSDTEGETAECLMPLYGFQTDALIDFMGVTDAA